LFEAVDGSTIPNPTSLSAGNYGLLNTYLRIYEDFLKNKTNNIMMIEDDCVFLDNFNDNLKLYIENIPDDWEILYFGANHRTHEGLPPPYKINEYVIKLRSSYTTHCLILKDYVFAELIENLKISPSIVDVMMCKLQEKYNTYSTIRNITFQLPSFSDIENKYCDYNWLIK